MSGPLGRLKTRFFLHRWVLPGVSEEQAGDQGPDASACGPGRQWWKSSPSGQDGKRLSCAACAKCIGFQWQTDPCACFWRKLGGEKAERWSVLFATRWSLLMLVCTGAPSVHSSGSSTLAESEVFCGQIPDREPQMGCLSGCGVEFCC